MSGLKQELGLAQGAVGQHRVVQGRPLQQLAQLCGHHREVY